MVEKPLRHISTVQASETDERSAGVIKAIWTLLDTLPLAERQKVQKQISELSNPVSPKKAGDVLGVVLRLIPRKGDWSVDQIKKQVLDQACDTNPKDIYNAVNYLSRKGCIRRISYGRYVTSEGQYFETAEDLSLEPTRREGDADD